MDRIILENVSKKIRGVEILTEINREFVSGKIYGLCGCNGSGKTMLLRMLAGLIRPSSGRVIVDGSILHKDIDFPENMGVLIENPDFWKNYTGKEALYALAAINKKIGTKEIDHAMERVGLQPNDSRTIKKYSLGMKKRLGIAQAIMEYPKLLLLDEPTNALDKKGVETIGNLILEEKAQDSIIILASHNKADLDICDVIFEMENGRIIGEI
jgi:ABC-2 type transport system ATP-binding protein